MPRADALCDDDFRLLRSPRSLDAPTARRYSLIKDTRAERRASEHAGRDRLTLLCPCPPALRRFLMVKNLCAFCGTRADKQIVSFGPGSLNGKGMPSREMVAEFVARAAR